MFVTAVLSAGLVAITAQAQATPSNVVSADSSSTATDSEVAADQAADLQTVLTEAPNPDDVVASSATTSGDSVTLPGGQVLTGLDDVQSDWFAEEVGNGDIAVVWGEGVATEPDGSVTTTADPSTPAVQPAAAITPLTASAEGMTVTAAAAPTGVCGFLVGNVEVANGALQATTRLQCTGQPPGTIYTQAQFRRSSWSGMRDYSPVQSSIRKLTYTQQITSKSVCRSGEGIYDYQINARGYSSVHGWSPWVQSETANRYNCGPGPVGSTIMF